MSDLAKRLRERAADANRTSEENEALMLEAASTLESQEAKIASAEAALEQCGHLLKDSRRG